MSCPLCLRLSLCILAGWIAGASLAQTSQTPNDPRLDQLGHADYAVRESATEALLIDESLTLEVLGQWAQQDLSLEQQHRLLWIAQHHTLRQMRLAEFPAEGPGSIGVVQSAQTQRADRGEEKANGVRITQVLQGFPGAGRLREGDIIVQINGENVEEGPNKADLFKARMSTFEAGQVLTLGIERQNQLIEVELRLANGAALPQMYPPDQFKLAPQYVEGWQEERRLRFATLAPQLLEPTP